MHGTILIYVNDPMLMMTRGLILEKAGYKVFTAETFENAMLTLSENFCTGAVRTLPILSIGS